MASDQLLKFVCGYFGPLARWPVASGKPGQARANLVQTTPPKPPLEISATVRGIDLIYGPVTPPHKRC